MRALEPKELEARKQRILRLVVHQYVKTAKPVSSQSLSEEGALNLSSATVRNVLSELEEDGYLTHPHTSAGRIPTDKGYRFFVDSLMQIQHLAREEEDRIQKEYTERLKELENVMHHTSHMLSSLSHYTGFVLTSKPEKDLFHHVELLRLGERKLMVVFVTQAGVVRHKTVALDSDISEQALRRVAHLLNDSLRGLTLEAAVVQAQEKLESFRRDEQQAFDLAQLLSKMLIGPIVQEEIYLEGTSNIFSSEDITSVDEARHLFHLMEEKQVLSSWVHEVLKDQTGVTVAIGAENPFPELKNMSLVSSAFKTDDNTVGVLGIIGPKRMEYPRMIALVDFLSRFVNKAFENMPPRVDFKKGTDRG